MLTLTPGLSERYASQPPALLQKTGSAVRLPSLEMVLTALLRICLTESDLTQKTFFEFIMPNKVHEAIASDLPYVLDKYLRLCLFL